jgi:hypothetical protein
MLSEASFLYFVLCLSLFNLKLMLLKILSVPAFQERRQFHLGALVLVTFTNLHKATKVPKPWRSNRKPTGNQQISKDEEI